MNRRWQTLLKPIHADSAGERARRRITKRIIPYVFILYVIAFLDRVNVGYAGLEMTKELGFTDEQFGFGAGIFFVGYFLLEIPGSLLVERWSARGWIARIMISWGIVAVLMGFVREATEFYWLRFLLGAAEAGFFPGMIVYLSHWFRYEDRGKAVAMFMSALPVSNIIGAPLSGWLMGVNWLRLSGWRWVFIMEGIPAIVFGVITISYLTDRPHQARWLLEDEREWIIAELQREKRERHGHDRISIASALRHREVILLAMIYFLVLIGTYGFTIWFPTILRRLSGFGILAVTSLSAIPYLLGLIGMIWLGWSSDRTRERRWHTASPMFVTGFALALSVASGDRILPAMALFCLAGAGAYAFFPSFWTLPTAFLTESAAAASIGLINSLGNLGGFVGPYLVGYLRGTEGSFDSGIYFMVFACLLAGGLVFSLRHVK
ncbi:MAG: MFS transporter [Acidobacteria bacterium]|nr:MFS transporter [Acidobacteriota bacterium]